MSLTAKYVIITPARDEANHIGETLKSVTGQSVPPVEWIIVDDGSTDRTAGIAEKFAKEFTWIRVVRRRDRGFRKSGGGVVEAFDDGFSALHSREWQYVVKLDADLIFPTTYFERCFEYFAENPRLGIGGGEIYHNSDGILKREANPRFHVRGATKIYRRACWEAIGGLFAGPGWDTIDEVKANMLGWQTYAFQDLRLVHQRITGAADGKFRDSIKNGLSCYASGYHPLFVLASCVYRIARRPYVLGSAALCYGFLKGYATDAPRLEDRNFVRYVRRQQLRRLAGLDSIWK